MSAAFVTLAALAAGYLVGRSRPVHRLRSHTYLGVALGRRSGPYAALFFALHPVQLVRVLPILLGLKKPKPKPPPRKIRVLSPAERAGRKSGGAK